MNPFKFSKDSYNPKTLLEAIKLEKLEIQLAKSRTAKITPKTLQIKWKGNRFEPAIIGKV